MLAWSVGRGQQGPAEPVGLVTSLPILWSEADDVAGLLRPGANQHWARAALSRSGPIVPLDTIEALDTRLARLVVAQPRPLTPAENVVLDEWVRGGGQLLLLADPLLTAPTVHPLGDPRRPQDIAMLSPILGRWGLTLNYDERQPEGLRMVPITGPAIPVNQRGAWRANGPGCKLAGDGLLAICRIGKGRVVALADAEVLADEDPAGIRQLAFDHLLQLSFSRP